LAGCPATTREGCGQIDPGPDAGAAQADGQPAEAVDAVERHLSKLPAAPGSGVGPSNVHWWS